MFLQAVVDHVLALASVTFGRLGKQTEGGGNFSQVYITCCSQLFYMQQLCQKNL